MDKSSKLRSHIDLLGQQYGVFEKAKAFYHLALPLNLKSKVSRAEVIVEKAAQATWLYSLSATKPQECRSLGLNSKNEFYQVSIEELQVEAKREKWNSWKCTTLKGLAKKLTPFHKAHIGKETLESAFQTLLSGKEDNVNSQKLGITQQVHIIEIHRKTEEPNYKKTHRIYSTDMRALIRLGLWYPQESEISLSGMKAFLKKPEVARLLDPTVKLRIKKIL